MSGTTAISSGLPTAARSSGTTRSRCSATPDPRAPLRSEMPANAILSVEGLTTAFDTRAGRLVAVDGLSFALARGETLAIVGESGCGKSVAALSIMRLLETPPANILAGRIMLDGQDLVRADEATMRRIRGA